MRTFALLATAGLAAAETGKSFVEMFDEFKEKFGKKYETAEEELLRLKTFVSNMEKAAEMSAKDPSAKYGHMSPLADATPEEMKKRMGFKKSLTENIGPNAKLPKRYTKEELAAVPDSFDWRTKGAVNAVKDQAQCGSCWAFGTVANIEGQNFLKTGDLESLSEQELVDCSMSDDGCDGGLPERAYEDMLQRKMGLEKETDYTYHATDGRCHLKKKKEIVFIDDWTPVSQDETEIQAAVMEYGPLAIGLNATPMQYYYGGISDPADCDPQEIDHAVTLVGWGVENGTKYWIIRNSWSSSWGEDGYYRLIFGKGACGMNQMVTSAIINKSKAEESAQVAQEDEPIFI